MVSSNFRRLFHRPRSTTTQNGTDGPLYFLHIEKTAGTSFASVLKQLCGPGEGHKSLDLDHISATQSLANPAIRYSLIRGHLRYEAVKHLLPAGTRRVTMLREPVARTISHLLHIQRHPEQNRFLEQFAPISKMSLKELLEHNIVRAYLTNFQAKKLALPYTPGRQGAEHAINAMLSLTSAMDKGLLEHALLNLSKFDFVGISERFEESSARLCRTLGYETVTTIPMLNQAPKVQINQMIDNESAIKSTIMEMTQLDYTLYTRANEQI